MAIQFNTISLVIMYKTTCYKTPVYAMHGFYRLKINRCFKIDRTARGLQTTSNFPKFLNMVWSVALNGVTEMRIRRSGRLNSHISCDSLPNKGSLPFP